MKFPLFLAAAALTVGLLPPAASAIPIVPPMASVSVVAKADCTGTHDCTIVEFQGGTPGSVATAGGGASATNSGGPPPSVRVHAQNAVDSSSLANASLTYFWLVVGPDSGSPLDVPLQVAVTMRVTATATAAGNAHAIGGGSVTISQNVGPTGRGDSRTMTAAACGANPEGCMALDGSVIPDTDGFSGMIGFTALQGDVEVALAMLVIGTAIADCAGIGRFPGTGACDDSSLAKVDSFIDPVVSIHPDFLATHPGFSLVFSNGIVNEPGADSVPEPGSIALLALGLAGTGLCRRKRAD